MSDDPRAWDATIIQIPLAEWICDDATCEEEATVIEVTVVGDVFRWSNYCNKHKTDPSEKKEDSPDGKHLTCLDCGTAPKVDEPIEVIAFAKGYTYPVNPERDQEFLDDDWFERIWWRGMGPDRHYVKRDRPADLLEPLCDAGRRLLKRRS